MENKFRDEVGRYASKAPEHDYVIHGEYGYSVASLRTDKVPAKGSSPEKSDKRY